MIAAAEDFACAADEVWRLQRGSDADCVFFQRAVNGGERITDRGTRQGTWVFSGSGELLARVNTRDVEKQLATLAKGLAAFEALPLEKRRLAADTDLTSGHRWEDGFPETGLALERIGRELGPEGLSGAPHPRWNRDFAWFAEDELAWAADPDLAVGDRCPLPLVATRLARFHLVDNVRGQTLPFAHDEIEHAELYATLTGIEGEGPARRLVFDLAGRTSAEAAPEWLLGESLWKPNQVHPHGIVCTLAGEAVYDPTARRFERFELVAVGRRWGRTVMNGRARDDSPGAVAFHFRPTERRIAPTFVAVYDAAWVPQPEVGTWRESPEECGLSGQ